ncbi:MAG TPA: transglutaminase domain-containing protein [Anaerolineae bacterium]|nr:transglutaminase domain-containing protein [Anaerolineae bacterium]
MVMLVAAAVGAANLVLSIDMRPILLWTVTLGVLSGFLLAKSRFPALTATIYATVYGIFVGGYLIGRTFDPSMIWRDRVADMVVRQVEFFTRIAQGNTNRDALIFVVHTTLVLWLLSVTAAWWTFRKSRPWFVILPSCLTMLSVIYYASPRLILYLALFCLVALLYIAQTHLLENKKVWKRSSVHYNSSINGNFMRSSLVVALLALAIVWPAPALPASASVGDAVNRVNKPWRTVRDNWQRLYSALNAQSTTTTSDPYRDTLTLSGARNPTDTPIMDVFVEEKLPYAYWRSTTLDSYDGASGQWRVASGETITQFPEDPPINIAKTKSRIEVVQTFVNYIPNAGAIYSAPDIVASDRQIRLKTAIDAQGYNKISATRSRYLLQLNDNYKITSQLSVANQTELRGASVNYSADIRQQYLAVPPEISERTRSLAADLTAPYDNPYDKALVVQNYLRNAITYNDQIDAPPPGTEPIDYFLFETRQGYCNYYASAFAMMLRTQGIPTRLSRGFAAGEYNEDDKLYRVRARDAHTWPEVYFPEYGWIQFEPTVIIDPIGRPVGEGDEFTPATPIDSAPRPENNDPLEDLSIEEINELFGDNPRDPLESAQSQGRFANVNFAKIFGALFVLGIAAALIITAQRTNQKVERSVDGSYGRLESWGRWLRLPLATSQTPTERSTIFSDAVPEGSKSFHKLISAFERKQFSPNKQPSFRLDTIGEWRTLRPLLFKQGFRNRLPWRKKK